MRLALVEIEHKQRDGFGGVPRSLKSCHAYASELNGCVIAQRDVSILDRTSGTDADDGTGSIAKLKVTCQEVSVQMREEHMCDPQAVFAGKREILPDIALWVDNCRRTRLLVTDQIRSVRETIQVKLLENHGLTSMTRLASPLAPSAFRA
jgi:hypothetical protein